MIKIVNLGQMISSWSITEVITPALVEKKMTDILKKMNYEIDEHKWLKSFLEEFEKYGFDSIEKFSSNFGVKDLKELKRLAMNN